LVAAVSPEVDAEMRRLLDEARDAIAAVPSPLAGAILNDRDSALAAYDAVQALRRALEVDVASALGVTLDFNGNDGD
jgi:predicted lipoprotein